MPGVPALHETRVDGVRCFWVASGRPTLQARLVFRHGVADEPVLEAGWQHLIEHLCLEQHPGHGALDINGSVDLHETSFDAQGEPDAVVAHLNAITSWLASPRLERLAHERQVLRAEAALRSGGAVAEALSWRYGARGPGLAAYGEPGLGRADEPLLRSRIARVFTADNAVLALDGEPPSGLRLSLPPGRFLPIPEAMPYETEPAAYASAQLVLSGTVRRGSSMFLAHSLVERALLERLRSGAGTAYAPWATYEPVDRDSAVVVAGSDFGAEAAETVGNEVLAILTAMAADGPPAAWLQESVDRAVRHMSDPFAAPALAFVAAHRHLHGSAPDSFTTLVDRARSLTVEQVAADVSELRSALLLGGPPDVLAPTALPVLTMPSAAPHPAAIEVRSINWPGDSARLHLHPERVAISDGTDSRAVALADLAAYLTFEDGSRHLLRRDGYGLTIDPRWWHRGSEAVAAVDRLVPAEQHLPQPARDLGPVQRVSALRRWTSLLNHLAGRSILAGTIAYALVLAPLAFFLQLLIMDRPLAYGIAWSCSTAVMLGAFSAWSERRGQGTAERE